MMGKHSAVELTTHSSPDPSVDDWWGSRAVMRHIRVTCGLTGEMVQWVKSLWYKCEALSVTAGGPHKK